MDNTDSKRPNWFRRLVDGSRRGRRGQSPPKQDRTGVPTQVSRLSESGPGVTLRTYNEYTMHLDVSLLGCDGCQGIILCHETGLPIIASWAEEKPGADIISKLQKQVLESDPKPLLELVQDFKRAADMGIPECQSVTRFWGEHTLVATPRYPLFVITIGASSQKKIITNLKVLGTQIAAILDPLIKAITGRERTATQDNNNSEAAGARSIYFL